MGMEIFGFGKKTLFELVSCLVIWASKSLRQFLGLGFKTKGRRFVGFCLKTNEQMKMV
jgi:hypothetical protein